MRPVHSALILVAASLLFDATGRAAPPQKGERPASAAKTREFTFHYQFRLKGLQPNADPEKNSVQAWLPCPVTSNWQTIRRGQATVPGKLSEAIEPRFGNCILFFKSTIPATGELTVDIPYDVVRREVQRGPEQTPDQPEKLDAEQRSLFLQSNTLVPTTGKSQKLLAPLKLHRNRLAMTRQLYDLVDDQVTYKKEGTGWGRGDTNWVCDSHYGNCTDFHSLFMSLARSQGLPTRFEIGFSIPTDKTEGPIAGYHCWAWTHLDDRGWFPVDISEADKHPELKEYYFGNLTADRVMFSTGRDIELNPKSKHSPLNFFIYPHVEVGGEKLPSKNVELQFSFKNKTNKSAD